MKKHKNYDEETVVRNLRQKHDVRVIDGQIQMLYGPSAKGDIGIGIRGKLDFLCNYKGYRRVWVQKF